MTDTHVKRYDPARLLRSFNQVRDFSEPSTFDSSGVHQGYRTAHLMLEGAYTHEGFAFQWLLEDFAPVYEARATILNPGGFIASHIDYGRPYLDRWQIPVQPSGEFVVEGDVVLQRPGIPWRVEYWKRHELHVPLTASQPRFTILVDRAVESPARPPDGDYEVFKS